MGNFLKRLKIANGQAGKVMTVDNDGVLTPSNKNVSDLADTTTTDALDARITTLEGAVEDVGQRLQDING